MFERSVRLGSPLPPPTFSELHAFIFCHFLFWLLGWLKRWFERKSHKILPCIKHVLAGAWKEVEKHASLCKAGIFMLLMTACAFQILLCVPCLSSISVIQRFLTASHLMMILWHAMSVACVVFLGVQKPGHKVKCEWVAKHMLSWVVQKSQLSNSPQTVGKMPDLKISDKLLPDA